MFQTIKKLIGVWSPLSLFVLLWAKGEYVGEDQLGNKYYRGKPKPGRTQERRWVVYKGEAEASSVPPEWHGWLHHQTNTVPSEDGLSYRKEWQKPHTPNLTNTSGAYYPDGHALSGGKRAKASGDYEAWNPSADTVTK